MRPTRLTFIIVGFVVGALVATVVTVGAISTTTPMNPGDTASQTCSGTRLTFTQDGRTAGSEACTGTTTTTTVPPSTTTTTAPTGTTTTTTQPSGGTTWWTPPQIAEFQWYLAGEVSNPPTPTQLGTGKTAFNGDTAPATDPTVIDVDGIENNDTDVSNLHAAGDKVVCYIEVGTAGNYYSLADEPGQTTTYYTQLADDGDLGNSLSGYPEKFININDPQAVGVIEKMITQCKNNGFDAVETDLDETFGNNEGSTGFTITQPEEESYLETLANYMHADGLAWFAKDLSDTGIQSFVSDLEPYADALIDEQPNQYGTIGLDSVFTAAGKAVFDAEYQSSVMTKACAYDDANNINGTLFKAALNGPRTPCM